MILLGTFLSRGLDLGQRAVVVWLAVPFIGYNFAVALPLTHVYTTVPAWTLLAGLAATQLWHLIRSKVSERQTDLSTNTQPAAHSSPLISRKVPIPTICSLFLIALFSGYHYTAYLRHDVEFWQDWPNSKLALFWSPYAELPSAGFFGFAHRAGWKNVGALYAQGLLSGDYGSNEEPDVTTWYTLGAPRACDPQPEYYFIADDLVDPWPVDWESIEANFASVGRTNLPNEKGLTIYQANPYTIELGRLQSDSLADAFDRNATPPAFARSVRGSQPVSANLGGLARLVGYDIDTRRAWPGGRVSVTLYWQAQASLTEDYHVFVHLVGDNVAGITPDVWGQADGRPVCWTYPTFDWRPGQIIADQHALTVKPDTPLGDYRLLIGMYLPDTGDRLEVLDEREEPIANFVQLTTVPIQ